jgi:hypothetical protein
MLQLGVKFWDKSFGSLGQDTPDGATAIAAWLAGTNGVAGLERKVFLNTVERGIVVVLDLAKFEKAS